jgi:hypothetical protein
MAAGVVEGVRAILLWVVGFFCFRCPLASGFIFWPFERTSAKKKGAVVRVCFIL